LERLSNLGIRTVRRGGDVAVASRFLLAGRPCRSEVALAIPALLTLLAGGFVVAPARHMPGRAWVATLAKAVLLSMPWAGHSVVILYFLSP